MAKKLLRRTFRYNGKRYEVSGHTNAELSEKEQKKKAELEKGFQSRVNPTLTEYFERWTDRRRGSVSEATMRRNRHMFESVANVEIKNADTNAGNIKLKDLQLDDLIGIQRKLSENRSTRTVNDTMDLIKHILKDAVNERMIDYSPIVLLKPLKRTEPQARDTIHRALDQREQDAFFGSEEVKNSYYYDVFRLAILSGMRVGEIGALKNSDIYGGFIHVERTVTRTEDGGYRIGDNAKTEAGRRKIPLTDDIKEVLKHQKKINHMLDDGIESTDDLIFKSPRTRKIIISYPVNKEIKRLCKIIGIEPFTIHGLRDTFCTRAIESGIDPKTLQELMGHRDISVTMNIYAHVMDETKVKAMNQIVIAI